jgi:hypothetical protein
MSKRFLSVFLLISFCGALSAQQSLPPTALTNGLSGKQKVVPLVSSKAGVGAILFPGIGQMQNGEKTKGAVFMGVGAALLGLSIYSGMSQQNLWKTYDTSRSSADYDAYKQRVYASNVFIGLTVSFWAYSVIDAFKMTGQKSAVTCSHCGLVSKKELGYCPKCGTKFN